MCVCLQTDVNYVTRGSLLWVGNIHTVVMDTGRSQSTYYRPAVVALFEARPSDDVKCMEHQQ